MNDINSVNVENIQIVLWSIAILIGLVGTLIAYIWSDRKSHYKADRREQRAFNDIVRKELRSLQSESTSAIEILNNTVHSVRDLFKKYDKLNGQVNAVEKDIVHIKTKISK